MRRSSVARLFVPDDCLVDARLQQMPGPDPAIEKADLGIAGTEPDGLLLGRDQLLDRPGHELAPAEMGVCVGPVAVERDHRLVFGNGLAYRCCARSTWPLAKCAIVLRGSAAKACSANCSARAISAAAVSAIKSRTRAVSAIANQLCAAADCWVERQGPLEQRNRLRTVLPRWRLQPNGAAA